MADNNSKALRSGVWYTFSNFLVNGLAFITTPIFTRLLSHTDFGLYSNFTSWMNIAVIIATLNLESTLISARYDFAEKFDQYIFSVLTMSSISVLIWTVILHININWSTNFFEMGDPLYINLLCLYLFFLPAINLALARERYYYRYKANVVISVLQSISVSMISILLVVYMNNRLAGRIIGTTLPSATIGLFLYIILFRRGKRVNFLYWKYALKICLPFIPHLLSLTILNTMDRVMITKICGAEDNALYSLAYTCGAIVTVLLTAMNNAFGPWIGEKLAASQHNEIRVFSKKYILLFFYLAVGIMLVAPEVLLILGGATYMDARAVMPPVAMGCICQFMYVMFVNVEQFKKKTIGMALASASAAMLNFALNFCLIPVFGYVAAAYTTLVGFLWLLIVHMFLVKRLGLSDVYDYRYVIRMTLLGMAIMIGVQVLYLNIIVRYIVVVGYGVAGLIALYKYKDLFKLILKR